MHQITPPVPGKYMDLLLDFSFKKIFASEPNKDLLIALLNEVFCGRKHIADLVYNKNEHQGDIKTEGGAIFDLLCTGNDGERFIIEVQRAKQEYFKQRVLFYTSRLISGQAPKGKRAQWKYNLSEVYLIALLENFTLDGSPAGSYLHNVGLCNRDTGEIFYDSLGFIYIELINFVKTEEQLETDLDRWLYILKNMSKMDKIPVYLRKPIFEKLFNVAEYGNLTKEEKMMYDSSMKYKWDNENVLDYAVKEAKKAGLQEKAIAIALAMKKEGFTADQIAKFAQLSVEEIERL
jgi:predicted transposase/invertase (TIGR01784 family)